MSNPVVIDFQVRGIQDIGRALRTVEQSFTASARAQTRAAEREAQARQRLVEREAKDKIRALQRADQEAKRAQDRSVRDAERAATQRLRAEEREMNQLVRDAERSASMRSRIEQKVTRDFEAMQKRQTKAANDAAKEQAREAKRQSEDKKRDIQRYRDIVEHNDKSSRERFGNAVGGGFMKTGRLIGRAASAGAGLIGQLGGGFGVAQSIQSAASLDEAAARLSNSATVAGGPRPDKGMITKKARFNAALTGMGAEELTGATQQYVAQAGASEFKSGMENQAFFGKIAMAYGANVGDVAKTAGRLRVQNKGLDQSAVNQMLLDIVAQGKAGSVEIDDLARAAGKITRTSSGYAGSQTDNQRRLLGLAQIAMRTAGSPEEAGTMIANVSADALKHADKMKKVLGKDFEKGGRIQASPEEFLASVMEKTGGDIEKITNMGFGARSIRMFQALAPDFQDAAEEAKSQGLKGKEVNKYAADYILNDKDRGMRAITNIRGTQDQLESDFKTASESGTVKLNAAMEQLRLEVGEKLLPSIVHLVPVIMDAIPTVARLVDKLVALGEWAESNPFSALGATISLMLTKEIAAAQIGNVIKNMLAGNPASGLPQTFTNSAGQTGSFAGAAPPGAVAAPGVGLGALAGIAAGGLLQSWAIGKDLDLTAGGGAREDEIAAQARSGDRAGARAEVEKAKGKTGAWNAINAYGTLGLRLAGDAMGMGGGILAREGVERAVKYAGGKNRQTDDIKEYFEASKIVDSASIQKAMTEAVVAGIKQGSAIAGDSSGPEGSGRDKPMTERN